MKTTFALIFCAAVALLIRCAGDNIISNRGISISIDSISPAAGTVGTVVRVYGHGFSTVPDLNLITVNGVKARVLDPASLNAVLIEIPQGAQTGNINLKANNVEVTGPVFTIADPPVFSEMKPSSGYEGTTVTIVGQRLTQVTGVYFNGVATSIKSLNDQQLVVIAPASTTGNVTLSYSGGTISAGVFTYLPIPLIQSVADGGKGLSITAYNINPTAAALRVYYDGLSAKILAVTPINANSGVLLPAFPPDDINNPFDISLVSDGIKSLPFRYTIKPVVTRVDYTVVSNTELTTTYDITIYGRYFGSTSTGNSADITVQTRNVAPVPNVISSWTPTVIVTRVTVSTFFSIGGTGAYRDYYATVTVNGVVSNRITL